ncbi:NAD(P)/FAD-dependent oxidoreductase [Minwuia sp.]|uniref:NAD(P)/FAD-dependent oxidoreductase n=1 Tax=Minwuia sp. TaxID=2493630 RepID=UPI003A94FECC
MIKVRGLPKDPGPSAWNALLGAVRPAMPLREKKTADWLVIGAGFAGLSAARRLTQNRPDDRIVVLDAAQVGEGPAGRNSGFMIDLPHDLASGNYGGDLDRDRAQIRANRAAIDFALDAGAAYGLPAEAIVRSGRINGAATARGVGHNRDFARHLSALGEDHEVLDAARMAAITGTDFYRDGLFMPHSAMIQPAMYVRGLADGLRGAGVAIHEHSPVVALNRSGGAWTAATPYGSVAAPAVILAVNGHANSFGFFKRRLMHVFTYAAMTRALTEGEVTRLGGEPVWGLTPADPMGTTVRRISGTGGDRIVVRNRFTYEPGMEVGDARFEVLAKDHDRSFVARFPMLRDVAMEYRWGGMLCLSRNDAPAFGEVERGLFAACCQNGLGTARGTFSGVAAADLASGRESLFVDHLAAAPGPSRLPPEPFAWLGINGYLRWRERKAGAEL